jgi:hypothetical protein
MAQRFIRNVPMSYALLLPLASFATVGRAQQGGFEFSVAPTH